MFFRMGTRRREKQETKIRSVNGIGYGSVLVWGGVMAMATFVSISSAIKLRRRKTGAAVPPPPPLPPVFGDKSEEIKQEEAECFGKGLHDLIVSDLKGKAEVGGEDEQGRCSGGLNHEEYHETNTQDGDEKEKGEDGEDETKTGACEEEVDEITMEEYGAAEDDSTEEDEEEEEEETGDNKSECKRVSKGIENQTMNEVNTETHKSPDEEDEEEEDQTEEETDEDDDGSDETEDDSSSSSNVEEMCLHLKTTRMSLSEDHGRDGIGGEDSIPGVLRGSNEREILMGKNWSKLRVMIVMIVAMALFLSLVYTVKKPSFAASSFHDEDEFEV